MSQEMNAVVPISEAKSVLPSLPIATQTHSIGLIQPPPDIRTIVDKTAQFVAKNGIAFEQRILTNEANNRKFSFLRPGDPYHAFYKKRVEEFIAPPDEKPDGIASVQQQEVEHQEVPPAPAQEKPDKTMYTVKIPEGITLEEVDVMRLTAQYVARNGKNFLSGVASREHANPQFAFIRPSHSLFGLFTDMCESYKEVLVPRKSALERLAQDCADRKKPLERALHRLEWDKVKEKEDKEAADEAEKEREALLSIDWHDFVVVEIIDFFDDEVHELPPPLTKKDLVLSARPMMPPSTDIEVVPAPEEPVKMDAEEMELVAEAQALSGDLEKEEKPSRSQYEPPKTVPIGDSDDEEHALRAPVVKNYVRRQSKQRDYDPSKYVLSPFTGEPILLAHMEEHMKVSLLDPRWQQQRQTMLKRVKETTKASDDEINRNLGLLARTRPDIFGSTDEEMAAMVNSHIRAERQEQTKQTQQGVHSSPVEPLELSRSPVALPQSISSPPTTKPDQAGVLHEEYDALQGAFPAETVVDSTSPVNEKKRKSEFVLKPESEHVALFPGPCTLKIQCAAVDGHESLHGQLMEHDVKSLEEKVGSLKSKIAKSLGMKTGQVRLSKDEIGFLREGLTLGHYNVRPDEVLQLSLKDSGK